MELDVNLTREGDEPWGFRLIGGTDFKMPLTVVKVLPDSPAEKAGLQNGDTVARIDDKVADDLSHEDARLIVDAAKMSLNLGVKRGLYDPVLDNYEPIYEDLEQIERADTDQPLQPTEVLDTFQIQQFLDPNQDIFPIKELSETPKPLDSRSLTASPFVLPAKPYRPFSTDPLQIPPLEDPIILNPNYKDEFGEILDGFGDEKYESRFKLPISEQYDPNWEKKEKDRLDKDKNGIVLKLTEVSQDVSKLSTDKVEVQTVTCESKEVMMKDDIAFMQEVKQEIDLDKIEMTATSIVDESIEKAKTVAEEIKKEIDVELSDVTMAVTESESVVDSQISLETKSETIDTSIQMTSVQKFEKTYESLQSDIVSEHEDLGIVKRETHVVKKSTESNEHVDDANDNHEVVVVAKKVEQFETANKNDLTSVEKRKSVQKEVEEVIETGTVRRKSMFFDREETNMDAKVKSVEEIKVDQAKTDVRNENIRNVLTNVDQNISETKISESKTSSSQAEHRAYTIGLKTIPNIRGTVHSSYHYNLLLQTFFLHLTDVMVALSRFILSEPIFRKTEEKNDVVTTQKTTVSNFETKSDLMSIIHEDSNKVSDAKLVEKQVKSAEKTSSHKPKIEMAAVHEKKDVIKEEAKAHEQVIEKNIVTKQVEKEKVLRNDEMEVNAVELKTHKKAISGSEMAQLSEKKSEELTVKMDAVISEFENKTGLDEVSESRRRSRSRSQIVEEVMKDSDPLEWLSNNDSQKTQNINELNSSSNEFSRTTESVDMKTEISSVVKSAAEKKIESRHGSRARSSTPNEGKQVYVAIVESHVYTNKDTILLDQTEISETASVQSTEETIVAMDRSELKKQKASISEDTRKEEVSIVATKQELVSKTDEVVKELELEKTELNRATTEHVKEFQKDVKTEKSINKVCESQQINIKNQFHEELQNLKTTSLELMKAETILSNMKNQEVAVQQIVEPVTEVRKSQQNNIIEDLQQMSIKKETLGVAKKETVDIQEIESKSLVIETESETYGHVELAKEELAAVKEEQSLELDISADIKIDKVEIKEIEPQIESAALKIVKEEIIEVQPSPEILESQETKVLKIKKSVDMSKGAIVESESKFVDISSSSSLDSIDVKSKTAIQESSFTAKSNKQQCESSFTATLLSQSVQESSLIAQSTESRAKKLTLKTDLALPKVLEQQSSVSSDENNNMDTPTPSTVPPTPLTDEYVFKLEIQLPKTSGIIIPLDPTPETEEDPHIVKKKMVPHIETTLESPVIYDPPLPSPPATKVGSPVYTKPGLRGGNIHAVRKEEILEIERKSTLLASAIDETIKSIEEYKEQVGMDTKKEESTMEYNSTNQKYSREERSISTMSKSEVTSKIEDDWSKVDRQVEDNNKTLTELSKISIEDSKITVNSQIETLSKNLDAVEDTSTAERADIIKSDNECVKINNNTARVQDRTVVATELNSDHESSFTEVVQTNEFNNEIGNLTNGGGVTVKDDERVETIKEKEDPMKGYRPVVFNPEPNNLRPTAVYVNLPPQDVGRPYTTPTGELLGTHQGIVDGLEEATVDEEVAKELGKPGMTEEKIAELISGESEMLREAHVMGLSRVLNSHMNREDGSSVDFKKIKPIVESLKDSEVLKALNDELMKTQEEKKKEERKWTTFMQKPKRAVPKVKFGYHAYVEQEEQVVEAPYKVKIVKQPKPKVAPDYKPETFDTGPLPWEERALNEPPPPPVEPEEPILIPEEVPEFLEAVDPLPESEVPDLEETGIPLPPPKCEEEVIQAPEVIEEVPPEEVQEPEVISEPVEESKEDMENRIADQLMTSVQNMVDPNASLEQQLAQMRAQLAALAQLPSVIQQTLELVTKQLSQITQQESCSVQESYQSQQYLSAEHTQQGEVLTEVEENHEPTISEETVEDVQREEQNLETENVQNEQKEVVETQPNLTQEEMEKLKKEEEEMLEEQRRIEKQKKIENWNVIWPWGDTKSFNRLYRINFLKYEKPPVSLDHLQHSDVYKLVHNMDQTPLRRVDMLTPVVAEADYREVRNEAVALLKMHLDRLLNKEHKCENADPSHPAWVECRKSNTKTTPSKSNPEYSLQCRKLFAAQ